MRILFVDDIDHQYELDEVQIHTAHTKDQALQTIEKDQCDMVFVNVKFNNDFVEKIRKLNATIPVFLINDSTDIHGLPEHAEMINGYYQKPIFNNLVKLINNPMYTR